MTERVKTTYSYDSMYRMASAAVTTDTGLNLSASYTYNNDLLTKIQTASTTYDFTYGNFALRTSVDIGERNLATYSYTQDGNNYLSALDYGNGDSVQYEYDGLGRVTKQIYEDGDTVSYQYDNSGALATVKDSATGRKTTYYYDLTDRMVKYVESGTGYSHSVGYEYNADNNLTSLVETINGTDYTTSYTYDDDNRVTSMTTGGTTVAYTYDAYGRVTSQVTKRGDTTILTETYTYVNPTSTTTSSQIATYTTTAANYSVTYTYTYDDNGNILSVNDGINTTSYVYDSANQLIRENCQRRNITYVWTYDNAGNILDRKQYTYTTGEITSSTPKATRSYTYGDEDWGDLLTAYNGAAITYDEIGNPLSDGTSTYTWEHGRQLATQTKNGVAWTYTYDANGMRTSRTSDTKSYSYVYSGDKLVQMTITDHTTTPETVSVVEFTYDAAGQPLMLTLDGTRYYYVLNAQGDVTGLVDEAGNIQIFYYYEGYGEGHYLSDTSDMTSTLVAANPLAYRGYVIDIGTAQYYLQSRYYDPKVGRFLNADGYVSTGQGLLSYNMFAYCANNPVRHVDYNGEIYGLPTLQDYYNIHKLIQFDILEKHGYAIEVFVNSSLGRGFLDIYNPVTNEYYEVKSVGQTNNLSTIYQMIKYDTSTISDWRFVGYYIESSPRRGYEQLSGSFSYKEWYVSYELTAAGLITYTLKPKQDVVAEQLAATVGIGIGATVVTMTTQKSNAGMIDYRTPLGGWFGLVRGHSSFR